MGGDQQRRRALLLSRPRRGGRCQLRINVARAMKNAELKSINARQGHVYMKKSLPLRKDGETSAKGMITLTVFCLKPGESAPQGEEVKEEGEDREDLEDLSKAVLGSSADTGDTGKNYHVLINIYRAENLAKISGANPNPFVTVEFAGVVSLPDMVAVRNIKPNCFKGKLLISGRVERLGAEDVMMAAGITTSRSAPEPRNMQLALLADVYEVCGAVGRECQVQLAFGSSTKQTKDWVSPGGLDKIAAIEQHGQGAGRIEPILTMAPEEAKSQPLVMVNVYTRGLLSGRTRVGYQMRQLETFKKYEPGNPGRPRYMPLEPMPFNTHARIPGSVLMVIEHFTTDDVPRHNRRTVKPMVYIVRAYAFMARNIKVDTANTNLALRVACAGVSKTTNPEASQAEGEGCGGMYMRQKDNMGRWEPYRLQPQWVKLFGGNYGSVAMGEVLIGFELLHSKFRADLPAIQMWPVPEAPSAVNGVKTGGDEEGDGTVVNTRYGLRDLIPNGHEDPVVNVRVKKFEKPQPADPTGVYYSMNFKYEKLVHEGQEDNKDDHCHKWRTDALGHQGCRNLEFFQVRKINVKVPDKDRCFWEILQPFIAIRVLEKPVELFQGTALQMKPFGDEGALIGESRQSLNRLYPCTWYEGVSLDYPYSAQENRIKKGVDKAIPGGAGLRLRGKLEQSKQVHVFKPDFWYQNAPLMRNADIVQDDELTDWNFSYEKVFGFVKCVFKLMDGWDREAQSDDAAGTALAMAEEVEDEGEDEAADAEVASQAMAQVSSKKEDDAGVVTEEDKAKLRRSVGFDDDLDSYAFDAPRRHLVEPSRISTEKTTPPVVAPGQSQERVPSRIRVRIYFVKAICIFGKQVEGFFGKAFIDPYLAYKLGNVLVSMRSRSFYRVEERDVVMPAEARLQVDLFDFQDGFSETINGEKLIGSTVIDLEDRWHSSAWRDAMDRKQQIPTEERWMDGWIEKAFDPGWQLVLGPLWFQHIVI
eukprot:g25860.t1